MESIVLFLFKSVLVSGLLTAWYCIGLRNKRLHQYNRFFLLFALCASLAVPLLHFQLFTIRQPATAAASPAKYLLQVVNSRSADEPQIAGLPSGNGINWNMVILIVAVSISIILLAILLTRVLWVLNMSRKYPATKTGGVTLVLTDLPKAPFSFLNYLFWKNSIPIDTENGRLIYQHELTHIQQKHTIDKLTCQALTCIFWMNPFYWFIQKELAMIHEFIADEHAIHEHDTDAFARMLLQTHNNGSYLIPEHLFFSSPIKRRLTMLQTNTTTRYSLLRRFAVLPLMAASVLIFSFTAGKTNKQPVEKAGKKIVLVLDAGHGGSDAGVSFDGLIEKDLSLKIVNRIKQLAPQYNVDVHLTRSNDEIMSLQQRVEISNGLHPDCFITIHVNGRPHDDTLNFDPAVEIMEFTHSNHSTELKQKTTALARSMYEHTLFLRGATDKSPWVTDKSLYVLRANNAPAIGIEVGVIQNKDQMARLTDNAKLDEICGAILNGVVEANKN